MEEMSHSKGVDDLSDSDWEVVSKRFSELLPKYGTLWRSMAERHRLKPPPISVSTEQHNATNKENITTSCNDGCCTIPSFLPKSQSNELMYANVGEDTFKESDVAHIEKDEVEINNKDQYAGGDDQDDEENSEVYSDESSSSSSSSSSSGGSTVVRFDHVDFEPSPTAEIQCEAAFDFEASKEPEDTQSNEVVEILSSSSNSDNDDDQSVQLLESPLLPNDAAPPLARHIDSASRNSSPDNLDTIIKKTKRLVILSSSSEDDDSNEAITKSRQESDGHEPRSLVNTDDEVSETNERKRSPFPSKTAARNPLKKVSRLAWKTSINHDAVPTTHGNNRGSRRSRFKFRTLDSLSDDDENIDPRNRDGTYLARPGDSSDEHEGIFNVDPIRPYSDVSQEDDSASRISGDFIASEDDYEEEEDSGYEDGSDAFESDDSIENIPHQPNKASISVSKTSFRRNRQSLAEQYFAEFDRKVFDDKLSPWTQVMWSQRLRTTAGCSRLRKITKNGSEAVYKATIELSAKVLDSPERLESTLLHEMCHVAAWVIDHNSKPPHGKVFKKWAKTAMKRVPRIVVTTTHDYEIEYKYAWACTGPDCGVIIQRHSRSVNVDTHICGKCKSKLVEINVPPSRSRSFSNKLVDMTPRKKAPPSAYNLFVKEHANAVRQKLQNAAGGHVKVLQADVMRECAKIWKERQTT